MPNLQMFVTNDKPMAEGEASFEPSKNNASPGNPSEEDKAHAEPPEDNVTVEKPNKEEKAIHKLSEDRVALVQRYDCKLWLSYLYAVKICVIDHFIYDKAG